MCGVLGYWGHIDSHRFNAALDRLTHRGPDGSGVWTDAEHHVMLGHRRLAIVDLSNAASQPMRKGQLTIIFNGEIYNFIEIRTELESQGEFFHTDSDTEVFLAAYQRWGAECLHRFNGMWAVAIWNHQSGSLFLARDRFGKKPLYYSFGNDSFVFGSEMKALMPLMDHVRISEQFHELAASQSTYESSEECLVSNIKRFPAGSFALVTREDISKTNLKIRCYWKTLSNLVETPATYEEQVDRFRELFVDACRIRMRSDVPVGTALSGGLDSSAVACTMKHAAGSDGFQRMAPDWQRAFVATFPETSVDESEYASAVTSHLGTKTVFLPVDPGRGLQNLPEYHYLFEELYWTSPVPMIEIYRAVRRSGVKVTLDGHGADELLSGYDGFLTALNDSLFDLAYSKHILHCARGSAQGCLDVMRQHIQNHKGRKGLIRHLLGRLFQIKSLSKSDSRLGFLNQTLYSCFHEGMLPTLLRNYDRYSMAAGVEIRMPFMDHRLVSFCFSLPWTSKIPKSSLYTKAILRDAIGPWMPLSVRNRRSKIGFTTPFSEWATTHWREFLLDVVHSKSFKECHLIQPDLIRNKIIKVTEGEILGHEADKAWAEITPYFWYEHFFKRAAA